MKMLLSCSLIAAVLVTPVFADEGNVAGAEDAKPRMQPLLNYETGSITTAEWDKAENRHYTYANLGHL